MNVQLHEIVISKQLTLFLCTTLEGCAEEMASLYEHRNDVEIDIRNLKVVLDTENIRARSGEMFHKELLAS